MAKLRRICNKPITKAKKPSKSRSYATARRNPPVIVDIDEFDKNNELAEVEYVEEIYMLYKQRENEGFFEHYMDSEGAKMRAGLISWLIKVHRKLELMPETLYLSINIIDRFCSVFTVETTELQLVGIAALLISSKYEEDGLQPMVDALIAMLDHKCPRQEVLAVEKIILNSLGWYLSVPTPYVFTVRYAKASLPSDKQMEDMAFYFTQIALIDYPVALNTTPSKISASAVYAARCILNKTPTWTETLHYYTGYSEGQVRDCANRLMTRHASASEIQLSSTQCTTSPDRSGVSLLPPATSLLSS